MASPKALNGILVYHQHIHKHIDENCDKSMQQFLMPTSELNLYYYLSPLRYNVTGYNGGLPSLTLNPYSWTKVANMLYLDTPAGTGFSYATSELYNSDTKMARDTANFLIEAS
ncbi:hypothetical protein POM88_050202 [Heracleum sosnowskyi]|uniref:Uncharacterized protein n=1 Tax=Heracleum sosnowskyi TaxID=360622 RepID=A0AAD8GYB5_9APIA|nr:hypothetical protein POM88_050202 [Heracleum sosnowskyi]